MKVLLIVCIFVSFSSSVFPAGSASNEAQDVSIIRLIAAPQEYAHKLVRIVGYLNIGFEGDAIYFHKEDFNHSLTRNAVWLEASPEMKRELKKLNHRYVILEGVFDPSDRGHMDLFTGTLNDITRADLWNP